MKKILALILALVMVFALVACGGEEVEVTDDTGVTADTTGADITDEQLVALTEAYNAVAPLYNEALTAAEANGWMQDETTTAELDAVGNTLGFIGSALTEDLTLLNGSNFEELTATILTLEEPLTALVARVSVPFQA